MRCHECGVLMVGIGTALACPCCNDLSDAIMEAQVRAEEMLALGKVPPRDAPHSPDWDKLREDVLKKHLSQREPTIPLTQVEAMLREFRDFLGEKGFSARYSDEWIQNKIKEARGG